MSEATSDVVTVTAPALVGVWVFDPTDPQGTARNYLHASGTAEEVDPKPVELDLVGRANPLIEYGEAELVGVALSILVPFGPTHDADVEAWRAIARNKRAICYRDNRGRLVFAGLITKVGIVDGRAGTAIGVGLRRIDYDESI